MGYDLHITRRAKWADEDSPGITEAEWRNYVAATPSLRSADDEYSPLMAICDCPSEYEDPWLDWFDGDVFTKNPDEPLIRFMIGIARDLDARVQGDDGEEYRVRNDGQVVWVEEGVERTLDQGREG